MTLLEALPEAPRSVRIGQARIDNLSFAEAVDRICDLAAGSEWSNLVVTPNIQHVVELEANPDFRAAYSEAAISVPDGWPVAVAARWAGLHKQGRVTGADLLPATCQAASERGLTIGLMGGQPGAVHRCADRLRAQFPELLIVFVHESPPGFDNDPDMMKEILDELAISRPNILFVGIGAPRQELFARRHRPQANVVVGVGAAVDFAAGLRPRAPAWIQRVGFEWLFRIAVEPRRLWRRYAVAAPAFVRLVMKQQLRGSWEPESAVR